MSKSVELGQLHASCRQSGTGVRHRRVRSYNVRNQEVPTSVGFRTGLRHAEPSEARRRMTKNTRLRARECTRIVLSLCVLFAAGYAHATCSSSTTSLSEEKPGQAGVLKRFANQSAVLMVGDSIAKRWPDALVNQLFGSVSVDKLTQGGGRIENLSSLIAVIPTIKATNIVVVLGTNNVRTDDECEFRTRFRQFFSLLRSKSDPTARVVVISILPKGYYSAAFADKIKADNDILRSLASDYQMQYVNLNDPVAGKCLGLMSCSLFEGDRLHPNDSGYNFMTETLRGCIVSSKLPGACSAD